MSTSLQDSTVKRAAKPRPGPGKVITRRACGGRLSEAKCNHLFRQLKGAAPGSRDDVRETLILTHLPVVYHLAGKFMDRGEPLEDLIQTGITALIGAVDRYDPDRGVKFITFATHAVVGEIKRYFRDRSWLLKVPRRLKELNATLSRTYVQIENERGYTPTLKEVAQFAGATEEEAIEAMELGHARAILSLDAPMETQGEGGSALTRSDCLGTDDPDISHLVEWGDLHQALDTLEDRERRIVELRFFEELSQSETAERLGMSQMHVSRLQRRALIKLKEQLSDRMYM